MSKLKKLMDSHMLVGYVCVAVLALVAMVGVLVTQLNRIDKSVFDASSESIEETYTEIAQLFQMSAVSRWNYLHLLGVYMHDHQPSDAEIRTMVGELEKRYGFSQFYFLSRDGKHSSMVHEQGYVDFGKNVVALFEQKKDIFMDGSLPAQDNMMFFAVPTESVTFEGRQYEAIAFGYDKRAMADLLKVSAYDGQSNAYIVYSSGRVAMSMGEVQLEMNNIFAKLKDSGIGESELEQIRDDFRNGQSNTHIVNVDGMNFYFSYRPMGIGNWMLVSFTSSAVANQAIDNLKRDVTSLVLLIFGGLQLIILAAVVTWYRRNIKMKNSLLQEREIIFSSMSTNMDEVYILYSVSEHKTRYVSPNIERILGLTQEQVYNSIQSIALCYEDEELWKAQSDISALKVGETRRDDQMLRNYQTHISNMYAIEVYRMAEKGMEYIVITISDRTQELQIRQEVEESLALAEEANSSKSVFLSNMSHDIRTPMNAIIGFTTLLSRNAENPAKVREYNAKIVSASKHLLSLINDVLDMSKIEAGKMVLNLEAVNVGELVQELKAMINSQATAKDQTFTLEMDLEEYIVMADRLRLSQILLNILSNAIKYTPTGGKIEMRVTNEMALQGSFVRYVFTVTDNGIGMSEEFLETIFQPFSRETNSTTNKIQGTGLGMSITNNMIKLMGGTINIDSELGKGSTFEVGIELRLADEDAKTARIEDQEEDFDISGLHILAAEDNELNSEILEELLEDEGVECDIVENGQEAVDKFLSMPPDHYDLILMDVQMPILTGYEATKKIRKSDHPRAKSIPIIAMTANAFAEDVHDAMAAGMDSHLAKPIYINGLKSKIKLVLSHEKE